MEHGYSFSSANTVCKLGSFCGKLKIICGFKAIENKVSKVLSYYIDGEKMSSVSGHAVGEEFAASERVNKLIVKTIFTFNKLQNIETVSKLCHRSDHTEGCSQCGKAPFPFVYK